MANIDGFDANEWDDPQSFDPIPADDYLVIATDSEFKPTKKGNGKYLQFTYEVIDGQHKGRKLWDRMNWENPNETAVKIGKEKFAQLCKSTNKFRPKDTTELHGVPVIATVVVEQRSDNGQYKNEISKYAMPNGVAAQYVPAQSAPATTTPGKPPWAK